MADWPKRMSMKAEPAAVIAAVSLTPSRKKNWFAEATEALAFCWMSNEMKPWGRAVEFDDERLYCSEPALDDVVLR